MLDGDEAAANLGLKMESIKKQVRGAATATGNLDERLTGMVQSASNFEAQFESGLRPLNQITREIRNADRSLEEMASSGSRSFGRITRGALQASEGAESVSTSLIQQSNAAEEAAQASERLHSSQQGYNDLTKKTTQTSQNLLRIMQDSQFGMMGMANNIQALGESLGRAGTRGRTAFQQLRGGIMSLLTGPMALPAAITAVTLLAQNWESLMNLPNKLEQWAEDIRDFAMGITEAAEGADRAEKQLSDFLELEDEDKNFFEALRKSADGDQEKFFGRLAQRADEAANSFAKARKEFNEFRKEEDASPELVDVIKGAGVDDLRRFAESSFDLRAGLAQRELRMRQTRDRIRQMNELMQARNAEQLKLQKRAEAIAEETGLEVSYVKEVLKSEKETGEEKKKQIDFQKRLNKLRVEGMEEGIDKQIASIKQSIALRKEEIRQANLTAQQTEKLIEQLNRISEKKQQQAWDEFLKIDTPEVNMQDPPLLMRNPTDQGPRFIPLEKAMDNIKKAEQRAMKELDRDRQALRDEREIGGMSGALERLGSLQIQFQLDMLEREQELRTKRLEKQKKFIEMRANIQSILGNEDRAERLRTQAGQIQQQIASVEERWYQKRLSQQQQYLAKTVKNIETTPLGDAYRGLFMSVGSVIQSFYDKDLNWAEKNQAEKASIIGEAGKQVVGAAASVAKKSFQSWKSTREQELKEEGKSQKERTRIMKEEGKRRFQVMKALQITQASIAGVTGAINAYVAGTNLAKAGVPAPIPHVVGLSLMGASLAATGAKINQIAGMSIGDKLSGGGASAGGGGRGGQFTQRAAASSASAANRAGTLIEQNRNNDEDKIKKTAERVGEEVANQMPESVKMDTDTAEKAQEAANNQQTQLNK